MNKIFTTLILCLLIAFSSIAKENEITLSGVPKKVMEAAKSSIKGIRIIEAEKIITNDGITLYELEGKSGEKEYQLIITPEGKVLNADYGKVITLSRVPEKVIAAAKNKINGIRLIDAKKITSIDGSISYKLEGKSKKSSYELLISEHGNIMKEILENDLNGDD